MRRLPRINSKVLEAIRNHPDLKGKSRRTVDRRINEAWQEIGKYHPRRAAAAYYASSLGINVNSLLRDNPEQLEELYKIVPPPTTTKSRVITRIRETTVSVNEKVAKKFSIPSTLTNQPVKMYDAYQHFYVFENLLRHLIMSTLERKHGKNWWDVVTINRNTRDEVKKRRKAEGRDRWVGKKRGSHNIFYTDLGDLGLIINSNWSDFKDLFPGLTWIKGRVEDLEKSRNILAHNNPLPKKEIDRIKIYLGDLQNQLAEKL